MVSYSEELKRRVINDLNENYGKDLLDLQKCKDLKKKLLGEKETILKEVKFQQCHMCYYTLYVCVLVEYSKS